MIELVGWKFISAEVADDDLSWNIPVDKFVQTFIESRVPESENQVELVLAVTGYR